jgi:hypothetical protein
LGFGFAAYGLAKAGLSAIGFAAKQAFQGAKYAGRYFAGSGARMAEKELGKTSGILPKSLEEAKDLGTKALNSNLWPSASGGPQVVNGFEYTIHALERMSPKGLIQKGNEIVSRGIPPSVVQNAIKFGAKNPGNTADEIVYTFENVRVVTNSETTRVITVINTGR